MNQLYFWSDKKHLLRQAIVAWFLLFSNLIIFVVFALIISAFSYSQDNVIILAFFATIPFLLGFHLFFKSKDYQIFLSSKQKEINILSAKKDEIPLQTNEIKIESIKQISEAVLKLIRETTYQYQLLMVSGRIKYQPQILSTFAQIHHLLRVYKDINTMLSDVATKIFDSLPKGTKTYSRYLVYKGFEKRRDEIIKELLDIKPWVAVIDTGIDVKVLELATLDELSFNILRGIPESLNDKDVQLTANEQKILEELISGKTSQEIVVSMSMPQAILEKNLNNIYQKTVKNIKSKKEKSVAQ